MLVAGFVSLWLALMSGPVIVELFDLRYADAAKLVTVMALFIPITSLRKPLGLMLQNAERPDLLVYAKFTAVIKIITGLWLVPKYGVMAMVWIAGLAILLEDMVEYYFVVTKLHCRTDELGILKMVINGAVAAGLFMLIRPWFTGLWGVLLSPLAFFVLYAGINLLNKTFRPEERDFINRYLKYPLWKF
jgi:O-antigen/teichoic acid export membrane protein